MTDFVDTYGAVTASPGRWRFPAGSEPVQWNNVYKGNFQAVTIAMTCGCTLTFHAGSPNIKAWECEHGNYIRCIDRFEQ